MENGTTRVRSGDVRSDITETTYLINHEYLNQMINVSMGYLHRAEKVAEIKDNSALNLLRQALEAVVHALYYTRYLELENYKKEHDCVVIDDLSSKCFWLTSLGSESGHWVFSLDFRQACKIVRDNGNKGSHVSMTATTASDVFDEKSYRDSYGAMLFILNYVRSPEMGKYLIESSSSAAKYSYQSQPAFSFGSAHDVFAACFVLTAVLFLIFLLAFVCVASSQGAKSAKTYSSLSSSKSKNTVVYNMKETQTEKDATQASFVQDPASEKEEIQGTITIDCGESQDHYGSAVTYDTRRVA